MDYLLSKRSLQDVEVYTIIKEFFKEYLQENYEFTFEELKDELKKTYIDKDLKLKIFDLLDRFSTIEYKDEEIPQEVLKDILEEFSSLIDSLIKKKDTKKKGLFGFLSSKKEELPQPEVDEQQSMKTKKKTPVKQKETKRTIDKEEHEKVVESKTTTQQQTPVTSASNKVPDEIVSGQEEASMKPIEEAQPRKQEQETQEQKNQWLEEADPDHGIREDHSNEWRRVEQEAKDETAQETEQSSPWLTEERKEKESAEQENQFRKEMTPASAREPTVSEEKKELNSSSPFEQETETTSPALNQGEQRLGKNPGLQVEERTFPEEGISASVTNQSPEDREVTIHETTTTAKTEDFSLSNQEEEPSTTRKAAVQEQLVESTQEKIEHPLSQGLNNISAELEKAMKGEDSPELEVQGLIPQADDINQLLIATERLVVEGQEEQARNAYQELLGRYHELPEQQQHNYYERIQRVYSLLS